MQKPSLRCFRQTSPDERPSHAGQWKALMPHAIPGFLIATGIAAISATDAMAQLFPPHETGTLIAQGKPFVIRERYRREQHDNNQKPGVVGVDILVLTEQYPLIQSVFPGTPAAARGIQAGDRIVEVDGVDTYGKTREQLDAMISEIPGSVVHFVVLRNQTVRKRIDITVMALDDGSQELKNAFPFLLSNP